MDYLVVLLIAVVVGVIIYFSWWKPSKEKDAPIAPDKGREAVNPIDGLLQLNLDIRKFFTVQELVDITEEVIDILVGLLPQVEAQDSATGELLWTVNRISTEYLPNKCVRPFIKLDADDQRNTDIVSSYKDNIAVLKTELLSVKALVVSRDIKQFNSKAKFLKNRFDNTGV